MLLRLPLSPYTTFPRASFAEVAGPQYRPKAKRARNMRLPRNVSPSPGASATGRGGVGSNPAGMGSGSVRPMGSSNSGLGWTVNVISGPCVRSMAIVRCRKPARSGSFANYDSLTDSTTALCFRRLHATFPRSSSATDDPTLSRP